MSYWEYHDKKIKEIKKLYDRTTINTKNRIQELLSIFDFKYETLYNIADNKTKNRIDLYIENWKEQDLLNGYFGILANNIYKRSRVKNSEILELLIYGAYIEEQEKENSKELQLFKEDVSYYYNEGVNEVRKANEKKKTSSVIPDAIFLALLDEVNSQGFKWNEYKQVTIKTNADQICRQVILLLMQKNDLKNDFEALDFLFDRQNSSKLNINGEKISGATDLELICINNKAKLEGIKHEDNNAKVKLIAVVDEHSTDVCKSLNNQEFYINKPNTFYRLYGSNSKDLRNEKITCFGLVPGLNLPPINYYFHWCRSTITYILNKTIEKEEIDNYLRLEYYDKSKHKNYDEDYERLAIEYQQIPENVRNMLKEKGVTFKFDYNRKISGYKRSTKEILIAPNPDEGELIHEIGHAIYYNMNVKNMKEYQNLVNDIFKHTQRPPKEVKDRSLDYFALDTDYKVSNDFQVYLGETKNIKQIKDSIYNKELPELFSEAYRCYYDKKEKKLQSDEINKLVEEVEKKC